MPNNFPTILRDSYERIKYPTAIFLVATVAVAGVVSIPALQTSALCILGLILVEVLFDIHKKLTTKEKIKDYPDFFSVAEAIRNAIDSRIKNSQRVRIRAIGMSMGHAWHLFSGILIPLLEKESSKHVIRIELAMIDSDWGELARINPDWIERSAANYNEILRFIEKREETIRSKGWEFSIKTYRYMPNWHGVLLDDEELFLSSCFWNDGQLSGAENQYEHVKISDGDKSRFKISRFLSWFESIPDNL